MESMFLLGQRDKHAFFRCLKSNIENGWRWGLICHGRYIGLKWHIHT